MPNILLKVTDEKELVPWDKEGEKYLGNRNAGDVLYANIRRVRNPAHHRKAFAVLHFALDNQEIYPSLAILLEAVKIGTGYVEEIRYREKVYYKTKSISFAQMGQDEFADFYIRMLDVLAELTGIPQEILEEGGRYENI